MIIHLTNYQITLKGPSSDGKLNGLSEWKDKVFFLNERFECF